MVRGMEPEATPFPISPQKEIEASKDTQEEEGEFPFLGVRIDAPLAFEAGPGATVDPDDPFQVFGGQAQLGPST